MNARRLPGPRLAWALLASLLLHLALVADAVHWRWPPLAPPAMPLAPLELRLPPVAEDEPEPPANPPPQTLLLPAPPAPVPPPAHAPATDSLAAQPPVDAHPAAAEETRAPPAEALSPPAPDPALQQLPQRGRLVYQFYWGKLRWLAGEAVQQWEIANGAYTLSSSLATTGLFGLLRPFRLLETAKGLVAGGRLRPLQFTTQVNDDLVLMSFFNWEKNYFRWYEPRLGPTTQALPPNSFDKISFLFQLYIDGGGFAPAQVTMGRRLDPYAIENLGSEEIDIDGQSHPATHLRTSASAADTGMLDIWLSAADRLPLKMTFVNGAGDYFEQLITADSLAGASRRAEP